MIVRGYRDLMVWQKAMDLVVACYEITKCFPKQELYGLSSQLQRAAVSIPANIAEGNGRQHTMEFIQHLSIANGSLTELETHLQIAQRLQYINQSKLNRFLEQTEEIAKMINALKQSLKKNKRVGIRD